MSVGRSGARHSTVVCVVCGHTEDPETAEERWASRPRWPASQPTQWMCDECWHDDKEFPDD